ncbi:hypothetical protein RB598_007235 [Gaeumannomyces tritici]
MLSTRAAAGARATTLTIDGLWHCLCPSVDPAALVRALAAPCALTPARPRPLQPSRCQRRLYSSATPTPSPDPAHARSSPNPSPPPPQTPPPEPDFPKLSDFWGRHGHGVEDRVQFTLTQAQRKVAAERRHLAERRKSLELLRTLRNSPDLANHAVAWAKRLRRDISPKNRSGYHPLAFDILIRSQANRRGSAGTVRHLLRQMQDVGVDPTQEVYGSALRALTIHPDYELRNWILKDIEKRGLGLRLEDHHSIAIGLLRDGQYELALDKLESMVKTLVRVPDWVFDVFTYTFTELGFYHEVFQIIQHRLERDDGREPPVILWYYILDSCSRGLHYEGTKFVWNRVVETNQLNPPDGVVLNVLNTASGAGDTALATQSIRLLAARGTKLGLHHYEPLIECYSGSDEFENALRVLCIMAQAGMEPDSGSTRSMFQLLQRLERETVVHGMPRLLFRAKERKEKVPVAAVNVVMEGMLHHGARREAIDLYKGMRRVSPSGPNLATFDMMLRMHEPDPRLAAFLAAEMAALAIKPGRETYDHMVRVYAEKGSLETALRYLDEMGNAFSRDLRRRGWLTPSTAVTLLRRCIAEEHAATWAIIEECEARGQTIANTARKMLWEKSRADGGASSWGPPPKQKQQQQEQQQQQHEQWPARDWAGGSGAAEAASSTGQAEESTAQKVGGDATQAESSTGSRDTAGTAEDFFGPEDPSPGNGTASAEAASPATDGDASGENGPRGQDS